MRSIALIFLAAGCSFTPGRYGATRPDPDAAEPGTDSATDSVVRVDAAGDAAGDAAIVAPATCTDGMDNGDESDLDCGGSCGPCAVGQGCGDNSDCDKAVCDTSRCRYAVSCNELHQAHTSLGDGAYSIDPDATATDASFVTFCDMTVDGGGWTLVGKTSGRRIMHATWLVSNVNVAALSTATIASNAMASVDAVKLAVDHSTTIRFANSARTQWVKWPLPAGRAVGTFWRHTVGQATISAAAQPAVTVTAWNATTATCYQNVYGVMPLASHGGAYPATSRNTGGNTSASDLCMAVGTLTDTTTAVNGFTQNGNGFDAPMDESGWPNAAYDIDPHVAVWLR